MDFLSDASQKRYLFKESMYSVLKQMAFKCGKTVEPNYFGFDCFARKGINDDYPTIIEFVYVENTRQRVSIENIKFLISDICKSHEKLNKFKILLISNSALTQVEVDKEAKYKLEIWGKKELNQLIKDYPIDFYTFMNDFKGIGKYITTKKIAEKADMSLRLFKQDANYNRVTLILGAGVSKEYGSFDLDELAQSMITYLPPHYVDNSAGVLDLIGKSTAAEIHFVKEIIGIQKYTDVIYSCLYKNCKTSFNDSTTTLYSVASLIKKYPSIDSVITFNYDDYLEQILVKIGVSFRTLFTGEDYLSKNIPIYHVHGFLPENYVNYQRYINSIILSEDELFKLYSDNTNWQVSVQLTKLKDNLCLFVGSSLRDYNLKKVLQLTKQKYKRHYAIMVKTSISSLNDMLVVNRYFSLFNVEVIWVDSPKDIAKLLMEF